MEKILKKKAINRNTKFYGVDNYEHFNKISKFISLSKGDNLNIYSSLKKFYSKNKNLNKYFLHDFGVSHYEFNSTKNFCDFINKFEAAFIKIAFLKKNEKKMNISGTKSYYFSLKRAVKFLNKPLYFLFAEDKKKWSTIDLKSNNFFQGYFYVGNDIEKFENLLLEYKRNKFLKAFLKQIQFNVINVKKLKI